MQIRQIRDYHAFMQAKGANMTLMAFTKPTGYYWYSRGWVVSGYAGGDSHKFFSNKQKATDFAMSRLASENRE